jgi:hypothetical protein
MHFYSRYLQFYNISVAAILDAQKYSVCQPWFIRCVKLSVRPVAQINFYNIYALNKIKQIKINLK